MDEHVFFSIYGQDAVLKLGSFMSPKKLLDTSFEETSSSKLYFYQRVITAERVKFLSLVLNVETLTMFFLARLREDARHCDLQTLQTATNPEEELVKRNFISGLRDSEAKLRIINGIKAKSTMTFSEMTENLQFRSPTMASASSSTGNKLVIMKEEVGYNFKIPSEN